MTDMNDNTEDSSTDDKLDDIVENLTPEELTTLAIKVKQKQRELSTGGSGTIDMSDEGMKDMEKKGDS